MPVTSAKDAFVFFVFVCVCFVLPLPVYLHVLLVRSMVKLDRDWVEYVIDVALCGIAPAPALIYGCGYGLPVAHQV